MMKKIPYKRDRSNINLLQKLTMTQLNLFDAEEFYEFPKDLLDYKENFLSKEEADLLKDKLFSTVPWNSEHRKCMIKRY